MHLRQRTASWICLILIPAMLPLYSLSSGGNASLLLVAISCASYLLSIGLYIRDHDRSIGSRFQGYLLILIAVVFGVMGAILTWFILSFDLYPLFG